jgi:hypothetical protein
VSAWIGQGRVPFAVGVWVVHAALALVIMFLFWRRIRLPRRWVRQALARAVPGRA